MKKDNSTFSSKRSDRLKTLQEIDIPVVMETHGGWGKVFASCYSPYEGCVFENDRVKADFLASQRPGWAVYRGDAEKAIRLGAGSHLGINLLDCDPYGSPWPYISAFFETRRSFEPIMAVVANDGMRHKLKRGASWSCEVLRDACNKMSQRDVYEKYNEIVLDLMVKITSQAGYKLRKWFCYYTGDKQAMTHYAAILKMG